MMNFFYLKNEGETWLINASKISGVLAMVDGGTRVFFVGGKEDYINLSVSLEVFSMHMKSAGATISN
jgi:hypothetical protein